MRSLLCATVFSALACASAALADYSTSPVSPLSLVATAADDVQPKIAAGPADSHYISYFTGSGYDVALQRLDKDGKAMWKSPTLVKDRTLSSTTDYGMASDSLGNAYVAYDTAAAQIEVSAISPTGSILWTVVMTTGGFVASAQVTVASDGFVWVAHVQDATTRVQRFDPVSGAATFVSPLTVNETGATQNVADIEPSIGGAVILSCVRYTTFLGAKILRAHRIESNGTRPWAAIGVSVFTTGSLQFGNFPQFIPDGAGGGYFAWYATGPLQCHVQRIDANGALIYGTNGTSVTTTTTFERVDPSMLLGADGRLYVFWGQHTAASSIYGVYGQCFAKGVRQWGILGAAIEPMGTTYSRTFARAIRLGDGVGCTYDDSTSAIQDNLKCAAVSATGAVKSTFEVATNPGSKYRFATASAVDGGSVLAWQGGVSTGASDVWAARINADNTLGPPAPAGIAGDLNGDGAVNAQDLAILLSSWGGSGIADIDGDGVVDAQDLAILLSAWT